MFFENHLGAQEQRLRLLGQWRARKVAAIERELAALELDGRLSLHIEVAHAQFDTSGAWVLQQLIERARRADMKVHFDDAAPQMLGLIDRTIRREAVPVAPDTEWLDATHAVESIGRRAVRGYRELVGALAFLGRVALALGGALIHVRRLRPTAVARHVYDTGITAIPIVSLIALLISVILAYMGAQQLQQFGADVFVADLVTVGVLRELGVLLTAIIIAGRSGSAFAAEIGAMRLNEEVDALHAIGVDPVQALVVPRLLGLLIALPLLTVIADTVGLIGGGLLCHTLLDMPMVQYVNRVQSAIAPTTFWVGIIKAPVFAIQIALAGCRCGLRVRGSSRDLGRQTTRAVVESIFYVILADALFAVLFMRLNI